MSRSHVLPGGFQRIRGFVQAPVNTPEGRGFKYVTDMENAQEILRAALAAQLAGLDAPDCVFHLEAFTEDAGLTFGECAIRLPGALSPQVNKLTFGVDLFDVEIGLALGEELSEPLNSGDPDRFYGYALLRRPKSGSLTQQDFERNFRFDEIQYSSSPDTPLGPYGRVGQAIVSDQDELKLERTIEEIVRFNEAGGGYAQSPGE